MVVCQYFVIDQSKENLLHVLEENLNRGLNVDFRTVAVDVDWFTTVEDRRRRFSQSGPQLVTRSEIFMNACV